MSIQDFIFSKDISKRTFRHLLFWAGWFLLTLITCLNAVRHVGDQGLLKMFQGHALISLIQLMAMIPFCYSVVYFIVPRFFLSRRYAWGLSLLVLAIVIEFCFYYLILRFASPYINYFLGVDPLSSTDMVELPIKLIVSIYGPLSCSCLISAIMFYKAWQLQQSKNAALATENAQAALQLLKAQVNPHFLFNTLNNIYSFALTKSPDASQMVEKLYNIFSYMITDGQLAQVPLDKEIALLKDYIELERIRYDERLDLEVTISGNPTGKRIAPLLFIPFVENSFKHGCSKMLDDAMLRLSISIERDSVFFHLLNNKPRTTDAHQNGNYGIGIPNVQRRLGLIYPGSHTFKVESGDDLFSVSLHVILENPMEVVARVVTRPQIIDEVYINEVIT
jgi:two-component system LytT family sensor kinase